VQVRDDALRHLSAAGLDHELAYLVRYLGHLGSTLWESHELYRWALQIFEEHGDAQGAAEVRFRLGVNAARSGAYYEAERIYRDSLAILRSNGRVTTYANCLGDLSYVYWALGDYQQAEQYSAESYDIAASIGYRASMAFAKRLAARLALARHDYRTARQHLSESLTTYEAIGLLGNQAETLAEYSQVCLLDGALTEAEQIARQSLTLCDVRSYRAGRAEPLIVLGQVACSQRNWRAARNTLCEALEVTRDAYLPPYALHALIDVARLFAALNKMQPARELVGFINRHPATWQWTREQLATLAADSGIDVQWNQVRVSRTEQRHNAQHNLWDVIAVVIEELQESQHAESYPQEHT
jgi:tetratricopeptide (TPR) repeat protein